MPDPRLLSTEPCPRLDSSSSLVNLSRFLNAFIARLRFSGAIISSGTSLSIVLLHHHRLFSNLLATNYGVLLECLNSYSIAPALGLKRPERLLLDLMVSGLSGTHKGSLKISSKSAGSILTCPGSRLTPTYPMGCLPPLK